MTRTQIQPFIDEKYMSVQKHPLYDLYLFNYTEKAQYERKWTEETLTCRGLILDAQDRIISRPLRKFFNMEEMGEDWQPTTEDFTVTMKMDGSLGISYATPQGIQIATRGSFTSDQALHATKLFQERYSALPWEADQYTYLFEIIFPANRIVVDYGDLDDLVLLAVMDTQTGQDMPLPPWFSNRVTTYDGITDLHAIRALGKDNEEGFVVRFQSGYRLKIKMAEYVRLHRLITGVNARRIWELLATGGSIDELIERVPEEFEQWVKETASELGFVFYRLKDRAEDIFDDIKDLATRKDQATYPLMTANRELSGIIFAMLDKKPYDHMIWKMIKPAAERPFKPADE